MTKNTVVRISEQEPKLPDPREYAPPEARMSRFSEEAAKAAQYVADLERQVRLLQNEMSLLNAHIQVVEESNALLHERILELEKTNERLAHVSSVIQTRISIATETLIGIQQVVPPKQVDVAPAIEKSLSPPTEQQDPDV